MRAIGSAGAVAAPSLNPAATAPSPPSDSVRQASGGGTAEPGEATIGEMAREFAVSLRTLRFYEDRALLAPRRDGYTRYYSASDRLRMQMILKGKHLGFTLAEIGDLIGAKSGSAELDFEKKLQPQQIASQISHLERQRAEIDDAIGRLRETYERLGGAPPPA